MKILIISLPRCGSTVLSKSLSKCFNLSIFYEPFNESLQHKQISYYLKNNNFVLKSLIHQKPNYLNTSSFYIDFYQNFDKVILLSRKNLFDACISYHHSVITDKWHETYTLRNEQIFFDKKTSEWFIEMHENILSLSQKIDIPITYYEDLYSGIEKVVKNELFSIFEDSNMYKYIWEDIHPMNRNRKFFEPKII